MLEGWVGSAGSRMPLVISGAVADVAEVMRTLASDAFFRIFRSFSWK
jgi:hypothetical protein